MVFLKIFVAFSQNLNFKMTYKLPFGSSSVNASAEED